MRGRKPYPRQRVNKMKDGDTLIRMINDGKQLMASTKLFFCEPTVQINAWNAYDNKWLEHGTIGRKLFWSVWAWIDQYLTEEMN